MGFFSFLSMLNPLPELREIARDPTGLGTGTVYVPDTTINAYTADILAENGIDCRIMRHNGLQVIHVANSDAEEAAAVLRRNGVDLTHPY